MRRQGFDGEGEYVVSPNRRKFPNTHVTPEIIEAKREQLRKERELWDVERELEEEILEFREIQDAWLEELVTLDDVLERVMELGLCKKLSVWRDKK